MCGKPLGSIIDAIVAAIRGAIIMSFLWVGFSWLTGLEISTFALFFGFAVSGSVAHRTGGRGILYQGIASSVTIVGLALSDAVVVRMNWFTINPDWPPNHPLPALLDQMAYQAQWDGLFLVFMLLGIVGGLWLWR